ncbi:response regulator transcription factor [Cupriavidus agavae]|uniref:LuxR family two component transcriptional regulator n=1 Tax=Cupriavidus agavae TaxID=1001822 RepID=A0A4Q7SCZ8_9BURK|nr:response regulator [Cupriavidus agavae]RZT42992.1 LuxR family two component transcriptional regulator [Cupriavidus agavae]
MKALPSLPNGRAPSEPVVYVVDDDVGMNDAVQDLLRSVGLRTRAFLSADAFLAASLDTAPGCVVMDVRLRGTNGLDVQREMERRGMCLPVVFITGHGDIEMSVRAMKAGAVDFLPKPFRDQDLLDAVAEGIAADRKKRHVLQCSDDLRSRLATLSDREREVMTLAASGLMNKQIAATIGISEVTIKIHRSRAMRKMAARTFADLVKMALELEMPLLLRETASAGSSRRERGATPQWAAPGY